MSPPPRDPIDGYSPSQARVDSTDPARDPAVFEAAEMRAAHEAAAAVAFGEVHADGLEDFKRQLTDGFRNMLTGIGDPTRDKTLGTDFLVRWITGVEAEDRWRGSDLGGRIVEAIPNEMRGATWKLSIQPELGERREPPRGPGERTDARRRRGDDWPAPDATAAPAHTPGALPATSDDNVETIEAIDRRVRKIKALDRIRDALNYERAYGGGAVLLGIDDGAADLTAPVDERAIKSVRHTTAYRGGWDGELIAWRYYNDPRKPNFGEPEIYMLRNLGVPISTPPAPGERLPWPQPIPAGPTGALIFFVHESRLLVFPGQPVSRRVRVQMRGWGDSIFTRVDEALSQFGQTWSGISILMQEFGLPVLKVDGLAALLASKDKAKQDMLAGRAIAMQMAMSIARMRMIDKVEELERLSVPLSGVGEVLSRFSERLAAAAGMPVSMLFGQVKGGLGDASAGDQRFFDDQIAGLQEDRLKPQIERLHRYLFLAADGPTGGKLPARWSVTMNPLRQPTDEERANFRKTIAETDAIYIDKGVVEPEEVAATRYGGAEYNDGPIVLDLEGRAQHAALAARDAPPPGGGAAPPRPGTGPTPPPAPSNGPQRTAPPAAPPTPTPRNPPPAQAGPVAPPASPKPAA